MKVNLAAVCMQVVHDKSKNIEKIINFIDVAAERCVKLLVFPECSVQGYTWTWDPKKSIYLQDDQQLQYFLRESETIQGSTIKLLTKHAARNNMLIQLGFVEKVTENSDNVLYNSVAIVGPEGLVGVFRKVHMGTNPIFQNGDRFSVFKTNIGMIGPIICSDIQYPESVRVLALKGAEIITMSTAWGLMLKTPKTDKIDLSWTYSGYFSGYKYDLLTRAACLQNGVWMIVSDQVGASERSFERSFGHSRIIDPSGRIIAGIGYQEGLVIAEIDIQKGIDPIRFTGRRPRCYNILVRK
jgi:predicted amidohydrolase